MYVSEIQFSFHLQDLPRIHALAEDVMARMGQLPGCRQVVVLRTAPDRLTSFVTYDTMLHAEAAEDTVADLFGRIAPLLVVLPQRQIYPALFFARFDD